MRALLILTLAIAAFTAACGPADSGGQANPTMGATPPGGSEEAPAEGDTIKGTLGGDPDLEGGCVWVDDGKTRWQVQWPDGYTVSTDPIGVKGPDGLDIAEGDTVTVTGTEQSDVMTTCQVGPVWSATSVNADG